jgi:hypothetical protein
VASRTRSSESVQVAGEIGVVEADALDTHQPNEGTKMFGPASPRSRQDHLVEPASNTLVELLTLSGSLVGQLTHSASERHAADVDRLGAGLLVDRVEDQRAVTSPLSRGWLVTTSAQFGCGGFGDEGPRFGMRCRIRWVGPPQDGQGGLCASTLGTRR